MALAGETNGVQQVTKSTTGAIRNPVLRCFERAGDFAISLL